MIRNDYIHMLNDYIHDIYDTTFYDTLQIIIYIQIILNEFLVNAVIQYCKNIEIKH